MELRSESSTSIQYERIFLRPHGRADGAFSWLLISGQRIEPHQLECVVVDLRPTTYRRKSVWLACVRFNLLIEFFHRCVYDVLFHRFLEGEPDGCKSVIDNLLIVIPGEVFSPSESLSKALKEIIFVSALSH